jgi:hypothetical protein
MSCFVSAHFSLLDGLNFVSTYYYKSISIYVNNQRTWRFYWFKLQLSQKLDFTRMLASPTWHTRCMLYDDMTQLFQKKDDMTQRVMTSLYYKERRQLKTFLT